MVDTVTKNEGRSAIPLTESVGKNGRKMPTIIFIENVEDYSEKYGHEQLVEEINAYYR